MKPSVVIDCFPASVFRYQSGYAMVVVDVIRATTMAITGVSLGRRCFVADTLEAARCVANTLSHPLLTGELGGDVPPGFDMNNSPALLAKRHDLHRPMVLLSSSGTNLICNASRCATEVQLACFRNFTAVARQSAGEHGRIAVIGAGSRNEFREEDQMCCAWVAELLMQSGYVAETGSTREIVRRWSGASPSACMISNSVGYLRRSNQLYDLDFILSHIDDVQDSFTVQRGEVVTAAKCAVAQEAA